MKISPAQLKKVIREVIKEAEEESPTKNVMPHGSAVAQKARDTEIVLQLKGLKPGKKLKQLLQQMAADARWADLEVINAEIKAQGKSVLAMDDTELNKRVEPRTKVPQAQIDAELDTIAGNMKGQGATPEERLANIKQGEKSGEWKDMEKRDLEVSRQAAKLRSSQAAAGTLKTKTVTATDPGTGEQFPYELPTDDRLWTDREWELWDTGKMKKERDNIAGSFKQSDTIRGQKGAVGADFTNKLK